MIDITNDKFWESDYEIKKRNPAGISLIKKFVNEHRVIAASLICLTICVATNICLIYNFFKILKNF